MAQCRMEVFFVNNFSDGSSTMYKIPFANMKHSRRNVKKRTSREEKKERYK